MIPFGLLPSSLSALREDHLEKSIPAFIPVPVPVPGAVFDDSDMLNAGPFDLALVVLRFTPEPTLVIDILTGLLVSKAATPPAEDEEEEEEGVEAVDNNDDDDDRVEEREFSCPVEAIGVGTNASRRRKLFGGHSVSYT